ncbi:MAG: DUF4403 family protein [Candidatus Eisenbacteria bacterium]
MDRHPSPARLTVLFPSRRSAGLFVGFVLLVIISVVAYIRYRLDQTQVLDAPAPVVVADIMDSNLQEAASTIEVLVTYNLSTAVDSLEAAVPLTYGDLEQQLPIATNKRASFAYTVSRSPFTARVNGKTLSLSSDIEYQGRVWYRSPLGPVLGAGCGTGNGERPRVSLELSSTCELTPRWQLRTHTRVMRLEPYSDEPRDRCKLTVLRIDVTDRAIAATREMLERNLLRFDEAVGRWPVRKRFTQLWTLFQRRIRLTDDVYLEINPYAAQLGSVDAVGDTVNARLRVTAAPRIVTGAQSEDLRPLPVLQPADSVGNGARVIIEASFTYPVATNLLRRALVGRSIVQQGHRIVIKDVQLTGIGGGRVALGVKLAGKVRGKIYFTGTPRLNSELHRVDVPDLDYDVGTAQSLVQGFAWLNGVDIRDFLRARATLPDSQSVGKLRTLAENGINRTLAPGVTLSGRIHDARGTSVRATQQEIRMRAVADADFKLAIDRGPKLPRPPQQIAGNAGK